MTQGDIPSDARRWQKPEGVWGNILEFILTWGAGLCVYLPINAVIVFLGWFLPETDAERANFWEAWHFANMLYLALQVYAANIGAQSRFAGKALRLFGDAGASLSPLSIPAFVFVLSMMNVMEPNEVQIKLCFYIIGTVVIDMGLSWGQYISTQRVEEWNRGK